MEWLWDQTCIRTSKRLISAEMIACRAQSDCLPPEKLQAKCESLTQIQNTHCWCTGKINKNKTSQTPNSNNSEKKIQLQNDHLYGHTSSNHVMYLSHKIIRWLVSISSHPFCALLFTGQGKNHFITTTYCCSLADSLSNRVCISGSALNCTAFASTCWKAMHDVEMIFEMVIA